MSLGFVELAAAPRNAELRIPDEDDEQDDEEQLKPEGEQRETGSLHHAAVDDDAWTLLSL